MALRHLIDALDEGSTGALKAMLPRLLGDLFGLMGKLPEIDDLVQTLETLVECFGEDIAPYALDLVRQLTQAFWRLQQVLPPVPAAGKNLELNTVAPGLAAHLAMWPTTLSALAAGLAVKAWVQTLVILYKSGSPADRESRTARAAPAWSSPTAS